MFYYSINTFPTPHGFLICIFYLASLMLKTLKNIDYFLKYMLFVEKEIHQKVRATEKILFTTLEL